GDRGAVGLKRRLHVSQVRLELRLQRGERRLKGALGRVDGGFVGLQRRRQCLAISLQLVQVRLHGGAGIGGDLHGKRRGEGKQRARFKRVPLDRCGVTHGCLQASARARTTKSDGG